MTKSNTNTSQASAPQQAVAAKPPPLPASKDASPVEVPHLTTAEVIEWREISRRYLDRGVSMAEAVGAADKYIYALRARRGTVRG